MGALETLQAGERETEALASEILRLARGSLLVNLRFLDRAISRLKPVSGESDLAYGDHELVYRPSHILTLAREEETRPARDCLHVVLHALFRHSFVGENVDRRLWNLATDMAVETIINDLDLPSTASKRSSLQIPLAADIAGAVKAMTAERIYAYLTENLPSEESLKILEEAYEADDHAVWYARNPKAAGRVRAAETDRKKAGDPGEEPSKKDDASAEARNQESRQEDGSALKKTERKRDRSYLSQAEREAEERAWKDIAAHIQGDLESFSKNRGGRAGSLIRNLREISREEKDYGTFLKKFAVRGEALGVNDEEFDYLFYTYGLELYDNMPLIEPLEYRDVKRIREFVIALDTSGSVSEKEMTDFVSKTVRVLKNTESFFKKIRCRILFADAALQGEVFLDKPEDIEEALKGLTVRGSGGTDFRPVFDRIEELRKSREILHMGGLLYFTDGDGIYPKAAPDYPAAFILSEEAGEGLLPPWAIRYTME